jgi:4-hydroxybutyrate CoA-transferase
MQVFPTAIEAVSAVESGARIYLHGQAATPLQLIDALVDRLRKQEVSDLEILHLHTVGPAVYADPEFADRVKVTNFFVGPNIRSRINHRNVDYLPCFLSEIPGLIRSGTRKVDVAFIHVSPPDAHGYCSLGTSVEATKAALEVASLVIAQINDQMPRTHGDGLIHIDRIHAAVRVSTPLFETTLSTPGPVELRIAQYAAGLIEDGSTLQMGIGSVPDAVLAALRNHQDLGIHTEMWTDGALDLILSGAVNNRLKKVHPGKTVSSFIIGTRRVYDFIHDNPSVIQLDAAYVNHPGVIARNPKVVAINSAVEVDLTGQVCADSIGDRIISGVGGQVDFITGASMSEGGKAIIALPSRTHRGESRITLALKPGAGVVTTRAHVHHVITEYGAADLYGKTIAERARSLIAIAHPDDREKLEREFSSRFAH